jgi:hypothetical protein
MTIKLIPSSDLQGTSGHAPRRTQGGVVWEIEGHHGWFVHTPNTPVRNGVYRFKGIASVLGPAGGHSYFDLVDWGAEGRIYVAHGYHADPEVYVRLYESPSLQVRFKTAGERVCVRGVEYEPLLMDEEPATPEHLRALLDRIAPVAETAAVHRLIDRLAHWGLREEAERRRAEFLASRERPEREVQTRLRRLHTPIGPATAEPRPCDGRTIAETVRAAPLTTYDLYQLTPEMRQALRGVGYEHLHLTANRLHRDYDEPRRIWHEHPAEPGWTGRFPGRQPLFERYHDIDRSHQASLAKGRGFPAYCPVSGRMLRSQHGFLQVFRNVPFMFYRFEGAEVFYVCTGQSADMKLFLYLPKTNSLVWLAEPPYQAFDFRALLDEFNISMATYPQEVASYLSRPTHPAAVVGNDNYGHFFWSSLTGLQYAVESELTAGLSSLIKVPGQFIDAQEIFPELAALPSAALTTPEAAFLDALAEGRLPIHFTNVAMNEPFVARLHAAADLRATRLPPPDAPRPLLWVNLRAHGRAWVSQVKGCASIFNALLKEHGALSVLLDGTPDCAEVAANIRALTRSKVRLYDGLAFSFYDKLCWARQADAYIVPVGTALMIAHSMAGGVGVAHANHEHLRQLVFWDSIRPGSGAPPAPAQAQVTETVGGFGSDYDVDWRVLLDLLRPVLRRRLARKG